MKSPTDIKRMAKEMVQQSRLSDQTVSHKEALDRAAQAEGYQDWADCKRVWKLRDSRKTR